MLDTSRQAAQEHYGEPAEHPAMSPPALTVEVESASDDTRAPGRPISVGRRKKRTITSKRDASLAGKRLASKSSTKAQKRDEGAKRVAANTANAIWFYNHTKRGDVVQIVNTLGGTLPGTDGLGDWNIPWEQWRAGNANA